MKEHCIFEEEEETMPRREKGILGVKRDPKNKILFSFNVRDGEEMPSDSDDSDYNPGLVHRLLDKMRKINFNPHFLHYFFNC